MDILMISGSLRRDSLNTALLRTLAERADGGHFTLADLRDIPMFDGDLEETPAAVVAFKDAIRAADGVLIATPEYNYSVPGVLKNALDWASRPAYKSPFRDKRVGMLSASMGMSGGMRAQGHLRQVLGGMAAAVFPWPEVTIGGAHRKVEDGRYVDAEVLSRLDAFREGFLAGA